MNCRVARIIIAARNADIDVVADIRGQVRESELLTKAWVLLFFLSRFGLFINSGEEFGSIGESLKTS